MNIIDDISNFIFIENDPEKSDIIFIPGGSFPQPSERAADLWLNGFAPLVLPSGKYGKLGRFRGVQAKKEIYDGDFETEWDFMKSVLFKSGVDEKAILVEKNASDFVTYDNAFLSRAVTDSLGLTINRAIICCKSFHARRCLMTYSWSYPDTKFVVCPSDIYPSDSEYHYPYKYLSKDNWFKDKLGIERVMSELQKCGQYFKEAIPVITNTQQ